MLVCKKHIILLFIASFLIFNLNFSFFYTTYKTGKGDTITARLLPFNILSGAGIYFDKFFKLYEGQNPESYYFFQWFDDHYVSSYPILTGLLSLPIYLPVYIWLRVNHLDNIEHFYNLSIVLEKISASLLAAVSVCLFFYLMCFMTKKKGISLFFALIFALATQTFSTSSQFLWQHGPANLFFILSLIFFLKTKRFLVFSFIVAILSIWSRPTFIIHSFILLIAVYKLDKKKFTACLTVLFLGITLLIVYNLYFHGSILGGYHYTSLEGFQPKSIFTVFINLLGVLFSPSRGILFYTPFFFLSLTVIFSRKKIQKLSRLENTMIYLNFFILIAVIIMTASWTIWTGGFAWGDRLLVDGAVPAVILAYYYFSYTCNLWTKFILFFLIAYSAVIQTIGVFYYPKGRWDEYPSYKTNETKLWNFKDNPIFRNLVVGPETNGFYNFLNLFKIGANNKIYYPDETKCYIRKNKEKQVLGYKFYELVIQNQSPVDWVTTTLNGPNINMKQIIMDTKTYQVWESPIPANDLPPIIRRGETVKFNMLILPPAKGVFKVIISPSQDVISLWDQSCKMSFKLINQ